MYKRAISLSPDNFFAHSNLGVAYAVTGRIDLAIENLTKAISLDPKTEFLCQPGARVPQTRSVRKGSGELP